jgi:hypothetical protein
VTRSLMFRTTLALATVATAAMAAVAATTPALATVNVQESKSTCWYQPSTICFSETASFDAKLVEYTEPYGTECINSHSGPTVG